jgi:putative hydrolase of the HAD superfamily
VFVPHGLEWEVEKADPPVGVERFLRIDDLGGLADLVADIV